MVRVLGGAGVYFMVIFVVRIRPLIPSHYCTTVLLPACIAMARCKKYEPQYISSLPLDTRFVTCFEVRFISRHSSLLARGSVESRRKPTELARADGLVRSLLRK
jgi:hypothetical protein